MEITEEIRRKILRKRQTKKIMTRFVRELPQDAVYQDRFYYEMYLLLYKDVCGYILQVCDIMEIIREMKLQHVVRGSAGSSLVIWLLGITHFDPIVFRISFARFLHELRENLPDVDIDVAHNVRAELFQRVYARWPNRVARISNKVTYGERGALRQAIKDAGYKGFLSRKDCHPNIIPEKKDFILARAQELEGKFNHYSLHCGGILIYPDKIPEDLRLDTHNLNQIKLDKYDVEELGLPKIDILSSRSLAVLADVSSRPLENYPKTDKRTSELFASGVTIGIPFAESRTMGRILHSLKPKTVEDIALYLSLVRPAASPNKSKFIRRVLDDGNPDRYIVCDDDAIAYVTKLIHCSEAEADQFRRSFAKAKWPEINRFRSLLRDLKPDKQDEIIEDLLRLRNYAFCRSHALSYGSLVFALGYQLVRKPKRYWTAVLNHCQSMYYDFVYFRHARQHVNLTLGKAPWVLENDTLVQAEPQKNRRYTKILDEVDEETRNNSAFQFINFGYWTQKKFFPGCFYQVLDKKRNMVKLRGLIACGRHYVGRKNKKYGKNSTYACTFITVCTDNCVYKDLVINRIVRFGWADVVDVVGFLDQKPDGTETINVRNLRMERIEVKDYL